MLPRSLPCLGLFALAKGTKKAAGFHPPAALTRKRHSISLRADPSRRHNNSNSCSAHSYCLEFSRSLPSSRKYAPRSRYCQVSVLAILSNPRQPMSWAAWNNGSYLRSGSCYGLRMSLKDRNACFQPAAWYPVQLTLFSGAQFITVVVNITPAFWRSNRPCIELRDKSIGLWLIGNNKGTRPPGNPPRFQVTWVGMNRDSRCADALGAVSLISTRLQCAAVR